MTGHTIGTRFEVDLGENIGVTDSTSSQAPSSQGGVTDDDFNQILNDMGRTVFHKPVTKTTNPETGTEVSTFSTTNEITVVFFLEEHKYIWDKEGLIAVGDAYVIAPISIGIKRYDQILVDGETFYVEDVLRRRILQAKMLDYATLFKVQ